MAQTFSSNFSHSTFARSPTQSITREEWGAERISMWTSFAHLTKRSQLYSNLVSKIARQKGKTASQLSLLKKVEFRDKQEMQVWVPPTPMISTRVLRVGLRKIGHKILLTVPAWSGLPPKNLSSAKEMVMIMKTHNSISLKFKESDWTLNLRRKKTFWQVLLNSKLKRREKIIWQQMISIRSNSATSCQFLSLTWSSTSLASTFIIAHN